jgi:hypothetical protein
MAGFMLLCCAWCEAGEKMFCFVPGISGGTVDELNASRISSSSLSTARMRSWGRASKENRFRAGEQNHEGGQRAACPDSLLQ